MFATFTAVYDACVFYPAPLRDLLLRLATTGLFRARWTAQIHDEWMRNVLKDRPDLDGEPVVDREPVVDTPVQGEQERSSPRRVRKGVSIPIREADRSAAID